MHRYEDWNMDDVAADDGMPVRDYDVALDFESYSNLGEGEWVQQSLPPYRCFDSCCDCGLVHEWEYKLIPCTDNPSEMTLWRRGWRRPEHTQAKREKMQPGYPRVDFMESEGWEWAVVFIPVKATKEGQ